MAAVAALPTATRPPPQVQAWKQGQGLEGPAAATMAAATARLPQVVEKAAQVLLVLTPVQTSAGAAGQAQQVATPAAAAATPLSGTLDMLAVMMAVAPPVASIAVEADGSLAVV